MKKYIPFLISFLSLLIISYCWDLIKLPYDNSNNIIGEYYYKKFNPINDTVRFLVIFSIPTLIYLISYLSINDHTYSFLKNNYFLNSHKIKKTDCLNYLYFFFLFFVILEFLNIKFDDYVAPLDIFHDGTFLVPFMNYIQTNETLFATFHDYGFIANQIGTIFYLITGSFSPGSIFFVSLVLIFVLKVTLLIMSKKLVNFTNFDENLKKYFFLIISLILITLPSYHDFTAYFDPRQSLYLIFIYLIGLQLSAEKINNYNYLLFGPLSILSLMWWFDIGAYTNAVIVLALLYLLIDKQKKNLIIAIASIIVSWLLFYSLLSNETINELIFQFKLPYSKELQYLAGIEFKKPFSPSSGRWTKAIVIIFLTSIMLINFNFSKKYKIDKQLKIFINLIFLSSIILFNSALVRSDSYHLKYTSGLYTFTFLFLIMFYIFHYLNEKKNNNINLVEKKKTIITIIFLCGIAIILNGNLNINKISDKYLNFISAKKNISSLLKSKDEEFLKREKKELIQFYKELSEDDNCVQILTDDTALSYFLKKRTCTQFFTTAGISSNLIENKFITQLNKSLPKIILYDNSKYRLLSNHQNFPKAINFINSKYEFFKKFEEYTFFKLKD